MGFRKWTQKYLGWSLTGDFEEPEIYVRPLPPMLAIQKIMIMLGVLHLVMAYGVFEIKDTDLRYTSAAMFFVAGVLCLLVGRYLKNIYLISVTGAFVVTAYASRAGLVFIGWAQGDIEILAGRTITILALYALGSVYAWTLFIRGLAPLCVVYRIQDKKKSGS